MTWISYFSQYIYFYIFEFLVSAFNDKISNSYFIMLGLNGLYCSNNLVVKIHSKGNQTYYKIPWFTFEKQCV